MAFPENIPASAPLGFQSEWWCLSSSLPFSSHSFYWGQPQQHAPRSSAASISPSHTVTPRLCLCHHTKQALSKSLLSVWMPKYLRKHYGLINTWYLNYVVSMQPFSTSMGPGIIYWEARVMKMTERRWFWLCQIGVSSWASHLTSLGLLVRNCTMGYQ